MIQVDNRGECCANAARLLPAHVDCPVQVTRLEYADVQWTGRTEAVWVELKRAGDLLASLGTKHMQDQEARLLDLVGAKFLVVVGEYHAGERGQTIIPSTTLFTGPREFEYPFAGVVNYLSRLQELGIGVVWVWDEEDLGRVLAAVYKRSLKARVSLVARRKVEHLDPRVQALKCLYTQLSLRSAESIIKMYGGPKFIPDGVSEKELMQLEGVGRLTARRLLGHET